MSSQLVRLFTCASIISLGGLTSMLGVVACSSDTTAAPTGDDDDDTKSNKGDDDDDTTNTKTDAGSSSSGEVKTRPASCKPEGVYTFGKATSKVTTAGKVCDNYSKALNENGGPLGEVTFTKIAEEDYEMTVKGSPNVLKLGLAKDRCQLAGAEQAYQQTTVDADNKEIQVAIGPNHLIDFDEANGAKDTTSIFVASDPPGAPGTPCIIQSVTTGTKK